MALQTIKGWNILKNCALIIISSRVWSKSMYEMISKISSMHIKYKYAKRNFLAEGPFVLYFQNCDQVFVRLPLLPLQKVVKTVCLEILQPRIVEWVAISFSRGSSWPRDWTQISCIVGRFFPVWTTRKALESLAGHLCRITFSVLMKTCKWIYKIVSWPYFFTYLDILQRWICACKCVF